MIGDLMLRRSMRMPSRRANLAGGELVADEQLVGDPLHLLGVQQHRAAPPLLEFEKPLRPRYRPSNRRCRSSSSTCWPGCSDSKFATRLAPSKMPLPRSPASAVSQVPPSSAAEIAHRVLAAHAGPVGERRSGEHDRAGAVGSDRRHHHDLPAGLAVADHDRLALGLGWRATTSSTKPRLGLADILDRLAGHRVRQEADEIAGMAGGERDADLAVLLHAADAWPVAGARVDDDERALGRVDRGAVGGMMRTSP